MLPEKNNKKDRQGVEIKELIIMLIKDLHQPFNITSLNMSQIILELKRWFKYMNTKLKAKLKIIYVEDDIKPVQQWKYYRETRDKRLHIFKWVFCFIWNI